MELSKEHQEEIHAIIKKFHDLRTSGIEHINKTFEELTVLRNKYIDEVEEFVPDKENREILRYDVETFLPIYKEKEKNMNSEEILKDIKSYLESNLDYSNSEILITPTMYDPFKLQHKVSFIIMQGVGDGTIPRFEITVNDLTRRNY